MITFLEFLEAVQKHTYNQIDNRLKDDSIITKVEQLTNLCDKMYSPLGISVAVNIMQFPYIATEDFGQITPNDLQNYIPIAKGKSNGNWWIAIIRPGAVVTGMLRRSPMLGNATERFYFQSPNYYTMKLKDKLNGLSQAFTPEAFRVDKVISFQEFNRDKAKV